MSRIATAAESDCVAGLETVFEFYTRVLPRALEMLCLGNLRYRPKGVDLLSPDLYMVS